MNMTAVTVSVTEVAPATNTVVPPGGRQALPGFWPTSAGGVNGRSLVLVRLKLDAYPEGP